ncbi:MAG: rhodanese-like domain-containing protein [Thiohalocapsa sp.]
MQLRPRSLLALLALALFFAPTAWAADPDDGVFDLDHLDVRITDDLPFLELEHEGTPVLLMRHQDPDHSIDAPYDKTARPCPPYCVQPIKIAPGVETIGELELIEYLKRVDAGDPTLLVIDSRTEDWAQRGTIPGSVHIPYTRLDPEYASPQQIAEALQLEFGAASADGIWDFGGAKTLVFFCNGVWCGQSPTNIKALLGFGYPAHRIKWYRGGMQAWESLGLTTVKRKAPVAADAPGESAR